MQALKQTYRFTVPEPHDPVFDDSSAIHVLTASFLHTQNLSLYKRAVDTGVSTLTWATSTTPYKLGAQYVYPLVQVRHMSNPLAFPTMERLGKSQLWNVYMVFIVLCVNNHAHRVIFTTHNCKFDTFSQTK